MAGVIYIDTAILLFNLSLDSDLDLTLIVKAIALFSTTFIQLFHRH